jgi:hypothetical protein
MIGPSYDRGWAKHELGHAVVSAYLFPGREVKEISINEPADGVSGWVWHGDFPDLSGRYKSVEAFIRDCLQVSMAGKTAEQASAFWAMDYESMTRGDDTSGTDRDHVRHYIKDSGITAEGWIAFCVEHDQLVKRLTPVIDQLMPVLLFDHNGHMTGDQFQEALAACPAWQRLAPRAESASESL